jgi:hypothetical protein
MSSDTPKEECTDCGAPVDWERKLTAALAKVEALRATCAQALDAIVWEAGSEYAIQSAQTRAALKALRAALAKEKSS